MKKKCAAHRMLWGLVYISTFLAVFIMSAVVKLAYNPLASEYKINWNDSVGKAYKNLKYGEGGANKFDLYVPARRQGKTCGLVVYIHAGGFTGGDKGDDEEILKWFCSKGYVSAGVNYTLFSVQNPSASVYTMSQDIKNSIPVIVEEAEKLGYKLDRMAISGGSAGGCLALLYAYRDAAQSPIPVKCVFEMVGPPSFHPEDWYGLEADANAASVFFSIMSGKTITPEMIGTEKYNEAIKDISPYMWIDENSVPTLCAYGVHDKLVPFGSVKYLIEALDKNKVPHDYIEFKHSGHGLQNDDSQFKQYMDKMNEYLDTYMKQPM